MPYGEVGGCVRQCQRLAVLDGEVMPADEVVGRGQRKHGCDHPHAGG